MTTRTQERLNRHPVKVYCDTGGFCKELKELHDEKLINLIMFPYENKNKGISEKGAPSKAQWNDLGNLTWDTAEGSWNDYKESDKHDHILEIIGKENRKDVLHIDSAYKSGCKFFITSDKKHILSKKRELEEILGLKFFHFTDDWDYFKKSISG